MERKVLTRRGFLKRAAVLPAVVPALMQPQAQKAHDVGVSLDLGLLPLSTEHGLVTTQTLSAMSRRWPSGYDAPWKSWQWEYR